MGVGIEPRPREHYRPQSIRGATYATVADGNTMTEAAGAYAVRVAEVAVVIVTNPSLKETSSALYSGSPSF